MNPLSSDLRKFLFSRSESESDCSLKAAKTRRFPYRCFLRCSSLAFVSSSIASKRYLRLVIKFSTTFVFFAGGANGSDASFIIAICGNIVALLLLFSDDFFCSGLFIVGND